ncbi:MAG: TIGR01777 family oxidoreductase [Thermoanaerobaculia bacterium]|nr:TIGR01777 family oxidoreductase [Thermoanaerobaculia bacterium]
MKIVISGGTGFIGEPLSKALTSRGEVKVLTRNPAKVEAGEPLEWHPPDPGPWQDEVASADVVINLAGENIADGRCTEAKKRRLRESRIDATRSIVAALERDKDRNRRLISASAVGYYGDRGDAVLDEEADPGAGFLSDLAEEWEDSALEARDAATVTILRFGIVIGPGGALSAMLPIFRFGLGGKLGSGEQWMPWVDREDLIRLVEWVIDGQPESATYNVTAPEPVRNREFTATLGDVLRRPTILPAPAFGLKIVLGDMAEEMLLASQRVIPKRATGEGFEFRTTELKESFERALSRM